MAFTEDLSAYFDTASGFAVAATYDGATAVEVIFDNEHLLAHDLVSTSNPVAIGKASVFPAAAVTKTLVIAGVTYTIRDRQPMDDGALVRLELETS